VPDGLRVAIQLVSFGKRRTCALKSDSHETASGESTLRKDEASATWVRTRSTLEARAAHTGSSVKTLWSNSSPVMVAMADERGGGSEVGGSREGDEEPKGEMEVYEVVGDERGAGRGVGEALERSLCCDRALQGGGMIGREGGSTLARAAHASGRGPH